MASKDLGLPADAVQKALELVGLPESMKYMTGPTKVFGHPASQLLKIAVGTKGPSPKSPALAFAKALGLLPEDAMPKKPLKRSPNYEAELQAYEDITAKATLAANIYNQIIVKAYDVVIAEANRVRTARAELGKRAGNAYLTPEESAIVYNGTKDKRLNPTGRKLTPAEKKKALLLSWGYMNTKKFEISETRVLKIQDLSAPYPVFPANQTEVKLGSIEVGQEKVVTLMQKVSEIIDTSVFEIFEDLKTLTTNIQAYFGNGLQDDKQATDAIKASNSIGTKTGKLADTGASEPDDGLAD